MLVDLNDASSIVTWWAVFPDRHGPLLSDWAKRRPQHRAAISEARRLISQDPERRQLMRQAQVEQHRQGTVEVVPLSHDELAAGEAGSDAAE
jgi:hypothetical protein